jgi:hypothetical protein
MVTGERKMICEEICHFVFQYVWNNNTIEKSKSIFTLTCHALGNTDP